MINLLKDILLSPVGSFASVFSLFMLAFWLVHWITKKITEIRTSQDKMESSVDSVYKRIESSVDSVYKRMDERFDNVYKRMDERFDNVNKKMDERFDNINKRMDERFVNVNKRMDERFDSVDKRFNKIEGHIDDMRKDISFLKAMIEFFQSNSKRAVAKQSSPISLTKLGIDTSKSMKAKEIISGNWDKIYADLDSNVAGKNVYDIQQYCMETSTIELSKFLHDSDLEKVKLYAFTEGRPWAYYAPIFGILIRDKYFEMKGIDIANVDKNKK